jgi:hypothetical protein
MWMWKLVLRPEQRTRYMYTNTDKFSSPFDSWFNHSYSKYYLHYYTCFGLTRTIVRCVFCCTYNFSLLARWSIHVFCVGLRASNLDFVFVLYICSSFHFVTYVSLIIRWCSILAATCLHSVCGHVEIFLFRCFSFCKEILFLRRNFSARSCVLVAAVFVGNVTCIDRQRLRNHISQATHTKTFLLRWISEGCWHENEFIKEQ